MRVVFVMDPISTVVFDKDTSFAVMREAEVRGHEVFHCLAQDVELRAGKVSALVSRAKTQLDAAAPIILQKSERIDFADLDAIFVRTDPPFNDQYLWLTLILEHVRDKSFVINDPQGLRIANEKLYACWFPELMPPHVVSASRDTIREFTEQQGGVAVIKPIEGHGGEGVLSLSLADRNANAIIDQVTRKGTRSVMLQKFLPEVAQGDKRILVLNGEPLGCFNRIPKAGDFRSNLAAGGSAQAASLTDDDKKILAALKPRLIHDGLYFVGLDVIGGYLTEVNVTSPTGIQQMSKLAAENLSEKVIRWVEERVKN